VLERSFERRAIARYAQVSPLHLGAIRPVPALQKLSCELECIAHPEPEGDVKLAREREVDERRMWHSPRHPTPRRDDAGDAVLREDVVGPLQRCMDRK
jgi:hypothetical protein